MKRTKVANVKKRSPDLFSLNTASIQKEHICLSFLTTLERGSLCIHLTMKRNVMIIEHYVPRLFGSVHFMEPPFQFKSIDRFSVVTPLSHPRFFLFQYFPLRYLQAVFIPHTSFKC